MGRLTITLIIVSLCLAAEASRSKRCIHGSSQGPTSTHSPCAYHTSPDTTSSSAGTIGVDTECGMLSGKRPLKRLVGGNTTNPHEWPSICRLEYENWYLKNSCGSTLVKNQTGHFYIITAAHCTEHENPKEYTVRCGVHDLRGDSPSYEQTFEVTRIINNGDFYYEGLPKRMMKHDISIIELNKQPNETDFVKAACLPSVEVYTGETSFVAGWGVTSFFGESPNKLHDLAKPIVSNEECEEVYNNATSYNSHIDYDLDCEKMGMLCAGYERAGKGPCSGDSGGPLYTERDGRWTLAGVVSYGMPPCAQEHYVDVYTDVYHHLEWINSKINNI